MPDPAPLVEALSPGPPEDPALDVRRLLAAGLAKAQDLAGEEWTDFNAHDPGVTILEVLAFALTDLGYRTAHPMADLVASSSASTGTALGDQPLFVGPDILTTAPVTLDDLRVLICDRVHGVRNAWIRPVEAAEGADTPPPGLMRVDLLPLWQVAAAGGQNVLAAEVEMARSRDAGHLVAETRRLLDANRPMGMSFATVEEVAVRPYAVTAQVSVAMEADIDLTVARIWDGIEMAVNPPPVRHDPEALIDAGADPDTVFDGPRPVHGLIDGATLAPMTREVRRDTVLRAILAVPGVEGVAGLRIVGGDGDGKGIPLLSRAPEAIAGLTVLRNRAPVAVDGPRVLSLLAHIEESRRWDVVYDAQTARQTDYGRIPLGRSDRALARYRSIQHLFPEIYGLGRFGVGDRIVETPGQDGPGAEARREALSRQLKGYLLVFEQVIADYLAQLDHLAPLLSFRKLDGTYFTQPLVHPAPAERTDSFVSEDPDDPPHIAPVLGAGTAAGRPGAAPRGGAWFERYVAGIARLAASDDDVAARREGAFDHLLARFNETFPHWQTQDVTNTDGAGLVEAKRQFLSDAVRLGAERGLGQDVRHDGRSALIDRVALKTGFEGDICLVEHILLHDAPGRDGIGDLEIGVDFHIDTPRAVRLAAGSIVVHAILRGTASPVREPPLDRQLAVILADKDTVRTLPAGAYRPWLRFVGTGALTLEILEQFSSHAEAEQAADALRQSALRWLRRETGQGGDGPVLGLARVEMPLDFFGSRVSLFLENPGRGGVLRNRVAAEIAAALPAHLARDVFWLAPDDMGALRRDVDTWRSEHAELARAGDAGPGQVPSVLRARASAASRRLKDRIHAAWCDAFLRRRGALPGPIRVG